MNLNYLESVVVPFRLVLVIFESHKAYCEKAQGQYDTAYETCAIESAMENNELSVILRVHKMKIIVKYSLDCRNYLPTTSKICTT